MNDGAEYCSALVKIFAIFPMCSLVSCSKIHTPELPDLHRPSFSYASVMEKEKQLKNRFKSLRTHLPTNNVFRE
ncbi:MAG: hypothetical protein LBT90_01910 [Holosporaceae bacterium]|nr:hypothetical protein [Holosporaceae bacterium]